MQNTYGALGIIMADAPLSMSLDKEKEQAGNVLQGLDLAASKGQRGRGGAKRCVKLRLLID